MKYYETPLKYGSTVVDEFIPKSIENVQVLDVEEYERPFDDVVEKLHEVLADPIESPALKEVLADVYQKGETIMLIIDDNTRPNIHTRALLGPLTHKLLEYGVRREDIKIIIASGSHTQPTPESIEKKILHTELYNEWKDSILIHDCDAGNKHLGKSTMGTPIYIDERVLDSCLVIPLSDSEYHYFAGQAGTVKLFCPGVAGRETIRVNHPRMFDLEKGFVDGCRLGNTEGNPVIQDMIDIAERVGKNLPMFCIDTIVHNGEIVYMQAGNLIACHETVAEPLRRLRVVDVDEPGDIVFTSVGELGLNLYQAGKGIHASWNAVRHDLDGWVVLLAPCEEGIGSMGYEEAMQETKDMVVKDALKHVIKTYCTEETFKIGNQKPPDLFRILLDVAERNIKLVTELDSEMLSEVYRMDGRNPKSCEEAQGVLREIMQEFLEEHPEPTVYVLNDPGLLVNVKNR